VNRQILISSAVALVLIGGTACFLGQVRNRQTLAPPGVRTSESSGSIRLRADLPERVLDYTSKSFDIEDVTLATLPKDTSFGQRRYNSADGFVVDLRVVLMGRDRTSMHKPQICLTGQGWHIDDVASAETAVRIDRPYAYDLPVVELVANRMVSIDGQNKLLSGVYVYWYVADDAMSASTSGLQRMWWMASKLLRTGVLQRWAYVSCFASCAPGQEKATFDRLKQFIAAAAPEFQLYPRAQVIAVTSSR
jgi:hypothetical protein